MLYVSTVLDTKEQREENMKPAVNKGPMRGREYSTSNWTIRCLGKAQAKCWRQRQRGGGKLFVK